MGGIEKRKEECRDARRTNHVESLVSDTRYAARTAAKNPGFFAAIVLTLGLAVGANSAISSVMACCSNRRLTGIRIASPASSSAAATTRSFP
jgi:hypothetical protein